MMTVRTIAELKTNTPVGVPGGTSVSDLHDIIDTFEALTSAGGSAAVNLQTGTTYTLQASDAGKLVAFTNAGAVTLTLPNSLAAAFRCTIAQIGAGQVTVSYTGTIVSVQSLKKTALTGSGADLWVYRNTGGTAAEYWLAGDLVA